MPRRSARTQGPTTVTRPATQRATTQGGRGLTSRMVDSTLQTHHHHAGPWIVWVLSLLAGVGISILAHTEIHRALVATLIVVSTAGTGISVWHTNRRRSAVARWHTLITVSLSGAWLALITVTGAVTIDDAGWRFAADGVPVTLWLVGGGFLALAWNNRVNVRYGELRDAQAAGEQESTDPWTQAGFPGVSSRLTKISQYYTTGTVYLKGRGNTLQAMQSDSARAEIELAFGWPHGSLTLTKHPGLLSSRRAFARVMHKDPLRDPVPWPGLEFDEKELARV